MEKMKQKLARMKVAIKRFERLRLRKMHLDYLAGLLTLPVLLTAIILNLNNLNRTPAPAATKPTMTSAPQIIVVPGNNSSNQSSAAAASPTPQACQKVVGPVVISSPTEGQNVRDNPVCISISYPNTNYCPVVWSYSINNGASWSAYSTDTPCLYNLPNGNIQFQLRVNSTVSSDTTALTRDFTYTGANNPVTSPTPTNTPVPTPTTSSASSSATTN